MKAVRLFVVGLALWAIPACGSDATGPHSQTVVAGTYLLRTVNGQALPATVFWPPDQFDPNGSTMVIYSSVLTLNAATDSGQFQDEMSLAPSTVPVTWTAKGDSVSITQQVSSQLAFPIAGRVNGDTLTLTWTHNGWDFPNGVYVYTRQ